MGTYVKEFDFKSVGTKTTSPTPPDPFENIPFGIRTPMQLGQGSEGILKMNFSLANQIKDNLRNLLLTNHGERLGKYRLGADLKSITFDLSTEEFDNEVLTRIKTAVVTYMPYVKLSSLQRGQIDRIDNNHVAKINTVITYNVPNLNLVEEKLKVTLFVGG